jgi:hypothetical protein
MLKSLLEMSRTEFVEKVLELVDGEWALKVEWTIGGQSGGSCWDEGESRHYAIDGNPEPEDETLYQILDEMCPDLTIREFRNGIDLTVIYKRSTRSQNEYYGNYTRYASRELDLDALHAALAGIADARNG